MGKSRREIKDFLDSSIKDLDVDAIFNTTKIASEFELHLNSLSDNELIDLLLFSIYIPDEYSHDSSEETLFTKLIEVLVAHYFKRLGLDSIYLTTKSGREDVAIFFAENREQAVVSDVKTFRLGRSQKAPNVKDFVKPSDFKTEWAPKHKSSLGGLIVFPHSHEWQSNSQVYAYCSDNDFPIIMLTYTHLVILLKYRNNYNKNELKKLWVDEIFNNPNSKNKDDYWKVVDNIIQKIIKIEKNKYYAELAHCEKVIALNIRLIIEEYAESIEAYAIELDEKANGMDFRTLKLEYVKMRTFYETQGIQKSIANIKKFRL